MRERFTLPKNPSKETIRLNPHLYGQAAKKLPRKKSASPLEEEFRHLWMLLDSDNLYPFQPEFRFCPGRRFRFDFAWPACHVAVELDGGTFSQGRHNRPSGFAKDCEKNNLACDQGWTVFHLCTGQVTLEEVTKIHGFIRSRTAAGQ